MADGVPGMPISGGDRAAGRAADVYPGHGREALQRIKSESERQHDDDGHGDGDAGQGAADQADQGAEEQRHQVFQVQDVFDAGEQEVDHRQLPVGP